MGGRRQGPPLTAIARDWPIVVRRARPGDRAAVLAFASTTFDGWDYIPHAWDHWIAADDGVLLVATAGRPAGGGLPRDADGDVIPDDQPIAVARVAVLSPTEAWLEGIRVDPRMRGLGIATELQVAELRWAAASGAQVVRYATGERNDASHRLGARHGFKLLKAFRLWRWHERPPTDAPHDDDDESGYDEDARNESTRRRQALLADLEADGFICNPDDGAACWSRLGADATFRAAYRLSEHRGWAMQELTDEMFGMHLERGEVVVSGVPDGGPDDGWALTIIHREALPAEDVDLHLGVLAGDGATALRLADEIRRTAGFPIRFWLPDPDPPLLAGGTDPTRFGFYPRPWQLHVLARPLDPEHPLPDPDDPAGLVMADAPIAIRPRPE